MSLSIVPLSFVSLEGWERIVWAYIGGLNVNSSSSDDLFGEVNPNTYRGASLVRNSPPP